MRAAILHDPSLVSGTRQLDVIETAARRSQIEVTPVDARDAGGIERAVRELAREPSVGLIVASNPSVGIHRKLIISLAERYRLPTVYPYRYLVIDGGLVSYGPDTIDPYRRAASYVDRILKGEKPADLPVQAPIKYDLVINLKTAKTLGLEISPTLLARAESNNLGSMSEPEPGTSATSRR
jgi:ABC-type uncharacterized transport system substrate-binding protein